MGMPQKFKSFAFALIFALGSISTLRAEEQTATVRIDNFSFTPAEIMVSPGTALTWVNGDDIPHTVAAVNKAFRSKALDTDQQFTFTFKEPGVYEYFCSLHPHMQGKVVVK